MNRINTHFMTGQIYKNFLYASCYEYNGLFKMNIQSGETSLVRVFPGEKILKKALYRDSVIIADMVFFIPDSAEKMAVYHIDNDKIEMIELPVKREGWCAYNAACYKEMIYMIPISIDNEVLVYNTIEKKFEKDSLSIKLNSLFFEQPNSYIYRVEFNRENLIIPIFGTNRYIKIDIPKKSVQFYTVRSNIENIIPTKEGCWLSLEDNTAELIENQNGFVECKSIELPNLEYYHVIYEFSECFLVYNKMEHKFQLYDVSRRKIKEVNVQNKEQIRMRYEKTIFFFRYIRFLDVNAFISVNMDGLIIEKDNSFSYIKIEVLSNCLGFIEQNIGEEVKAGNRLITESESFDLTTFLSFI